eukprot:5125790-Heterocapsa_arctica.AAC.1
MTASCRIPPRLLCSALWPSFCTRVARPFQRARGPHPLRSAPSPVHVCPGPAPSAAPGHGSSS